MWNRSGSGSDSSDGSGRGSGGGSDSSGGSGSCKGNSVRLNSMADDLSKFRNTIDVY